MTADSRPYQQRIIAKTSQAFLNDGLKSVMIESATGSGKSYMGLSIAKALESKHPDLLTVWVAMRRPLLNQIRMEHEKFQFVLSGLTPTSMFSSNFEDILKAKAAGRPVLLVHDECHHAAATSAVTLDEAIKADYTLGLSATPFRTDKLKLTFSKIIKDAGIGSLVKDGYLSKFHHYVIPKWNAQYVVEVYLADRERWGKSIIYLHTVEQCEEAAAALRAGGVRTEVVTGDSAKEEQLAAFRAGNLDVLVNCLVLTEGVDCPDLKTVFVRPSCKGLTIQMAGRVLRTHPNHPYKQIVQSENTPWVFTRTAHPERAYMLKDDGWRSLGSSEAVESTSRSMMTRLANTQTSLPKWLIERQLKGVGRRRRNASAIADRRPILTQPAPVV